MDVEDDKREEYLNLITFLERRLPELGLDAETYGNYILGAASEEETSDEWSELMELLAASTELEDLADDVWETLSKDIQSQLKLDQDRRREKEEALHKQSIVEMEAQLAKAKLEKKEETASQQKPAMDSAAKKALLSRFAYEEDGEEAGGGGAEGEAVMSNRQHAAQTNLDAARQNRSQKVQTKKEEQQKTKEQRQSKEQQKEERRKRAQKGERKR
eukprot:Nitzschia sp. Nitz4//scaffold94_size78252//14772//15419//NITZ4_005460-RA/size78252-processed-gene-0.19-mRNA-1//-1//CDS//3329560356//1212//frame0